MYWGTCKSPSPEAEEERQREARPARTACIGTFEHVDDVLPLGERNFVKSESCAAPTSGQQGWCVLTADHPPVASECVPAPREGSSLLAGVAVVASFGPEGWRPKITRPLG